MNSEKLRIILQLALAQLIHIIKGQQERLVLQQQFGYDAVLSETFHKPGRKDHAKSVWSSLEEDYKRNLLMAKEIQEALDKESEAEWEKFSEIFINNLKNDK